VLGPDFAGWLVADGLRVYASLPYRQQKCLWHLARNARELMEAKTGPAARFGRQVVALLRAALRLHHRQQAGALTPRGFASGRGQLARRCDRLLARRLSDPENAHLAERLRKHRAGLLAFLDHPQVPPTNARAEQEIRPAVVLRKTSACNRAETGAHGHEVLASLVRTCRKHGQSFIELTRQRLLDRQAPWPAWLTQLLTSPSATSPPLLTNSA
jgi:hypothetical protein